MKIREVKIPHYFKKAQATYERLSAKERVKTVRNARYQMYGIGPLEVLQIVIASNFNRRLVEEARETFEYLYEQKTWFSHLTFGDFGLYKNFSPPFYLGAAFELAPRDAALQLFAKEFMWGSYSDTSTFKAGHTLLRFSRAGAGASFARELSPSYPDKTRSLLSAMVNNRMIYEYKYRRYPPRELVKRVS